MRRETMCIFVYNNNWRAERAPLSVELFEFSLYLYIYI